jgi:hypothetical protein
MNNKLTQSVDVKKAQQFIKFWQSQAQHEIVQPISLEENQRHSGKDFRGIYQNPKEVLMQLSGDVPLGYNGYGCPIFTPVGSHDTRLYRFLASLALPELMCGHIRVVGPSGAGKSEFLFKLVLHLARNHDFSIVWFSTKWEDDQQFFESLFPHYTAISANDIALTRLTQGRFNPLTRIPINYGQVNPQDCRKMAEALVKCIPIKDVSGETEKFYRDAVVRLAALIELLKYCYGDQATLGQIPPLWVVLAESDDTEHPIEVLLQSSHILPSVKERLKINLLPLLRRQSEDDAFVGPTAQQLLSQFESLASVTAADDIANFSDRLRQSPHGQILVIDQSDGLNSSMSQALARLIFPQLYEELVAECSPNWQEQGLRPILMIIDEMGSVFSGELSDFLEKARSKGVFVVFGQQSSAGNPDPRLHADMSNNTRLQVVFSGCDSTDPQVQELSAVAGRFRQPFEPHRTESGFGEQERLPIDAITTLGSLASLVRIKSTTGQDRILWMHQGNPLVPYRQQILALRGDLASEIAMCAQNRVQQEQTVARLRSLLDLYAQTETLLLSSYGYWTASELANAYQALNLDAINRDYLDTMDALAKDSQAAREELALQQSRPEFAREALLNQAMTLVQWQHEQEQTKAQEVEAWLFQKFERDILPELQKHLFCWSSNPLKKPRLNWLGSPKPDEVARHWQAILNEYRKYAEAWGRQNSAAWPTVSLLVNLRVGQVLKDVTPSSRQKLEGLARWLAEKKHQKE